MSLSKAPKEVKLLAAQNNKTISIITGQTEKLRPKHYWSMFLQTWKGNNRMRFRAAEVQWVDRGQTFNVVFHGMNAHQHAEEFGKQLAEQLDKIQPKQPKLLIEQR